MKTYQSYRNLPALAGVCSMEEAMNPGLSVEECVRRLKRYHYAFKRLHHLLTARLTSEPLYELKMGFSLHAHLCAEHTAVLRQRVAEMREPPLGLEAVPDPALGILFDEILAAPSTGELLLGVHDIALPKLKGALLKHIKDTNPLADHPSIRVCRFALLELEDMLRFGAEAISAVVLDSSRAEAKPWLGLLRNCLAAAGCMDGTAEPRASELQRIHSREPYRYDPVP